MPTPHRCGHEWVRNMHNIEESQNIGAPTMMEEHGMPLVDLAEWMAQLPPGTPGLQEHLDIIWAVIDELEHVEAPDYDDDDEDYTDDEDVEDYTEDEDDNENNEDDNENNEDDNENNEDDNENNEDDEDDKEDEDDKDENDG